MDANDAAEVEAYEVEPFEVQHPWRLRWELWKCGRIKKKSEKAKQEFLPRCLDILFERDGLDPAALEPDEERFDPEDVEFARALLAPLFARHSLSIIGLTLRCRSDDGDTEVTSAMVTFH